MSNIEIICISPCGLCIKMKTLHIKGVHWILSERSGRCKYSTEEKVFVAPGTPRERRSKRLLLLLVPSCGVIGWEHHDVL